MLDGRETGFRHRCRFIEAAALSADVRIDVPVVLQCVLYLGSLSLVSACHHAVQTISSLSGRALVGGLFFRHHLVVTPSKSLTIAGYVFGLARYCLKEVSTEFTQFTARDRSRVNLER